MNHGGISPRVMNGYSPAEDVPASISRKRTHSMSEGLNNPPYVQPQLQNSHERAPSDSAWSSQDPQRHLPHPVAAYANPQVQAPHTGYPDMSYITPNRRAQVSPNGVPPASWRRDSISAYAESGEHDLPHEASFEWDEQAIDEYVSHLISGPSPLTLGIDTITSSTLPSRYLRTLNQSCTFAFPESPPLCAKLF